MEQFQNSTVMIKVINWLPVFVAYSGNEMSVYTAWANQEECNDLLTPLNVAVTTRHLRNPLIDRWSDVRIRKVKVELFKNNTAVVWMIFNGENTNEVNWFMKENLLSSSFNDLTTSSTTIFFDIKGDWGLERQFFINRYYDSCVTDGGWFVVCGKKQACAWEKKGVFPVFLYTKNGFSRTWHTYSAEPADRMVISVGI
ncbi:uncharacterized protein LOC127714320 [Mytilus californianus]|uniref:uncharacterized protein LOC127714320 n=1 Tax=Mytilus californianus TaxID=6549 RepID=UPI0022482A13|nr:uncharacterized protein LOC127714320 [Mytilus californianus]